MTPTERKEEAWRELCLCICEIEAVHIVKLRLQRAIDAYAAACVAEALAPRDPSPELAEAERWLKTTGGYCEYADEIRGELARLRAALAARESQPSRVVYVPAENEADALAAIVGHGFRTADATVAAKWTAAGERVFVVELRVRP